MNKEERYIRAMILQDQYYDIFLETAKTVCQNVKQLFLFIKLYPKLEEITIPGLFGPGPELKGVREDG